MLSAICREYSKSPILPSNDVRRLNSNSSSTPVPRYFIDTVHFAGNAANLTKMEKIEQVLKRGADVNVKNPKQNGRTFLAKAASDGNLKLVNLLFQYNADANIPDNDGNTPLMALAKRTIVAQGADTMFFELSDQLSPQDWQTLEQQTPNWNGMSSQEQALTGMRSQYYDPRKGTFYQNNFEIAKQLIAHGANTHAKNHAGETARILARKQAARSDYNWGVLDAVFQGQNTQTSPISRFFKRLIGDKITKKFPSLTWFAHN